MIGNSAAQRNKDVLWQRIFHDVDSRADELYAILRNTARELFE